MPNSSSTTRTTAFADRLWTPQETADFLRIPQGDPGINGITSHRPEARPRWDDQPGATTRASQNRSRAATGGTASVSIVGTRPGLDGPATSLEGAEPGAGSLYPTSVHLHGDRCTGRGQTRTAATEDADAPEEEVAPTGQRAPRRSTRSGRLDEDSVYWTDLLDRVNMSGQYAPTWVTPRIDTGLWDVQQT